MKKKKKKIIITQDKKKRSAIHSSFSVIFFEGVCGIHPLSKKQCKREKNK